MNGEARSYIVVKAALRESFGVEQDPQESIENELTLKLHGEE